MVYKVPEWPRSHRKTLENPQAGKGRAYNTIWGGGGGVEYRTEGDKDMFEISWPNIVLTITYFS